MLHALGSWDGEPSTPHLSRPCQIRSFRGSQERGLGTIKVGLLTGDNVINGDAPVVVMTTEVLRNMIYDASPAALDRSAKR